MNLSSFSKKHYIITIACTKGGAVKSKHRDVNDLSFMDMLFHVMK